MGGEKGTSSRVRVTASANANDAGFVSTLLFRKACMCVRKNVVVTFDSL